ncbi:MAG TPA: hypothetical protein VK191_08270 [Symbiobacteriaceae bacterium]|nr:hypothetical protein [Symbiobacteriaceae bacterium]
MGIRINLLPRSYQPPKPVGAREAMIAAAVGLTLFGGGAYYVSAWTGIGRMEQEIQTKNAQVQQVELKLADAASIKQREAKVTGAEGDLKALVGRDWSPLLENLAEMTPQHMTWSELKVVGEQVTLKGNARGLIDLAQLFGGMVNHPSVEYAGLRYLNEQGVLVTLTIKDKDGSINMSGLTAPATTPGATGSAATVGQPAGTQGAPGGATPPLVLGEFSRMDFEVFLELKPLRGGTQGGA